MSRTFEKTGRTIDEAIELACDELNLKRELLKYEILEEPNNGFLGFGTKKAKIKVFVEDRNNKKDIEDVDTSEEETETERPEINAEELLASEYVIESEKFLQNILDNMNRGFSLVKKVEQREIIFNIEGENVGLIIGKRGQTLNALQYLLNIVANRHSNARVRIILDAANYRENRKKSLYELSKKIASRVKENGKSIELEPMSSAERKTIHIALKDNSDVYTYSKGDEPYRKVVVSSKNKRRRRSNLFEN